MVRALELFARDVRTHGVDALVPQTATLASVAVST
jgi:hypothetical protein